VQKQFSGELYANYSRFSNYNQIKTLLPGNEELPFGEAPFHFVAHLVGPGEVSATSLSVTNLKEETETLNTTNGITTYLKVEKTGSTLTAIPKYTRTENTTLIIGG
jgi:hypothetical protein